MEFFASAWFHARLSEMATSKEASQPHFEDLMTNVAAETSLLDKYFDGFAVAKLSFSLNDWCLQPRMSEVEAVFESGFVFQLLLCAK
jgi:hypothetical protein